MQFVHNCSIGKICRRLKGFHALVATGNGEYNRRSSRGWCGKSWLIANKKPTREYHVQQEFCIVENR